MTFTNTDCVNPKTIYWDFYHEINEQMFSQVGWQVNDQARWQVDDQINPIRIKIVQEIKNEFY